jgi:hypothetical protein
VSCLAKVGEAPEQGMANPRRTGSRIAPSVLWSVVSRNTRRSSPRWRPNTRWHLSISSSAKAAHERIARKSSFRFATDLVRR